LQSRFFAMTIPLAALVLGHSASPKSERILNFIVFAMAVVGFFILHQSFARETSAVLKAGAIGLDDFSLLASDPLLKRIQQGDKLALIGDAKAFMYPIPMSDLNYRTVFDVDEKQGQSWIQAWLGADAAAIQRDHYLVIDAPAELHRLWRSYHLNLPEPDPFDDRIQILPPISAAPSQ